MPDIVISAEGLGKKYFIGHQAEPYTALRDVLAGHAKSFLRKASDLVKGRAIISGANIEEFWALSDVNFDVARGEIVGIIGRNGAGKSTLLKILSRITEPTVGRVRLKGRVASLLEVGTGFHPELTGRENILLNGAILGMSRAEIARQFDEIVAFAEVEKFLDTPVKRYSSGMYIRLAFAVAAHLEPEILIIDEVLAVGDAEFQKKCLGKMQEVSRGGRTVLFVSHNMAAIETLCSKAIYLRGGRVQSVGSVESQVGQYMADFARSPSTERPFPRKLAPDVELTDFSFSPSPVVSGDSVGFRIALQTPEPAAVKELAVLLYSALGTRVAILDLRSNAMSNAVGPGNPWVVEGTIESLALVEGDYTAGLYVSCGGARSNFLDLSHFSVVRRRATGDIAPFAPHERGLLELNYTFDRTEAPCESS